MIIIIDVQASADYADPKPELVRTVKKSWQRLPDSNVNGALTSFSERCHEGRRQAGEY